MRRGRHVVTGLSGREAAFLERVVSSTAKANEQHAPSATVRALGERRHAHRDGAGVERVLASATEDSLCAAALALLEGCGRSRDDSGSVRGRRDSGDIALVPRRRRSPAVQMVVQVQVAVPRWSRCGDFGGGKPALEICAPPAACSRWRRSSDSASSVERVASLRRDVAWRSRAPLRPSVPLTAGSRRDSRRGSRKSPSPVRGVTRRRGRGARRSEESRRLGDGALVAAAGDPHRAARQGGGDALPPIGGSLSDEQIGNVMSFCAADMVGCGFGDKCPRMCQEVRGTTMGRKAGRGRRRSWKGSGGGTRISLAATIFSGRSWLFTATTSALSCCETMRRTSRRSIVLRAESVDHRNGSHAGAVSRRAR